MVQTYSKLMPAVRNNFADEVKRLIEQGADVNERVKKYNGRTALMLAAAKGRTETISALTKVGADVNEKHEAGLCPHN